MFSFFQDFLALLMGVSGPELNKRRALRRIKKNLSRGKYKRFYKVKTSELTSAAAKFFFSIYEVIFLAQVSLRGAASSASFKELVIRHFLAPELLARLDEFTEKTLEEKMQRGNAKEVARDTREVFQSMVKSIDKRAAAEIDSYYRRALYFEQFIGYDYFFLLRRFNPSLREHQVTGNQTFNNIRAQPLSSALKDFLYIITPMDPKDEWTSVLELFNEYKNTGAIRTEQWYQILNQVQDVCNSKVFEYIVRDIDKNPEWSADIPQNREPIVKPWIDAKKRELDTMLDKLLQIQWSARIGELSRQVFGDGPVVKLSYYTERAGGLFVSRGFSGFIHAEGLNYLSAFIDIFALEINELCEFMMIRAWWALIPRSLSDQCLLLLDLEKRITVFDSSLKDDGSRGFRLYQLFSKSSRDKLLSRSIQDSLQIANEEARILLIEGTQALAVIRKSIDDAKNDYDGQPPLLIMNWDLLEQAAPRPLRNWLITEAGKLNAFFSMMEIFVQDSGDLESLISLE